MIHSQPPSDGSPVTLATSSRLGHPYTRGGHTYSNQERGMITSSSLRPQRISAALPHLPPAHAPDLCRAASSASSAARVAAFCSWYRSVERDATLDSSASRSARLAPPQPTAPQSRLDVPAPRARKRQLRPLGVRHRSDGGAPSTAEAAAPDRQVHRSARSLPCTPCWHAPWQPARRPIASRQPRAARRRP